MSKHNTKKMVLATLSSAIMFFSFAACVNGGNSGGTTGGDENVYSITLDYNDNVSRNHTINVEVGNAAKQPATPLQEGYTFDGWYTAATGGDKVSFPMTPSADTKLYAHWKASEFSVSFENNYEGAKAFDVKTISYNGSVSAPEGVPEREGYQFRYWAIDPEGNEEATFPVEKVKKDMSFYAAWIDVKAKVYNITIKYNTDKADTTFTKVEGETLSNKEIMGSATGKPSKQGYTFQGWATDPEGKNMVTIDSKNDFTPTADVTIYAIFKAGEYKITLSNNNNDTSTANYKVVNFTYGNEIGDPGAPTREGYVFDGWYTLAKAGTKVEFPIKGENNPTKNTTYYAHWTSNPVTTDTFQAEYVYINPDEQFPGYSGSAQGASIIQEADVSGVMKDNYPTNPKREGGFGYYLTYLYKTNVELVFTITATKDMTATLYANLAAEMIEGGFTIAPTGNYAYAVVVNGEALNYNPITIGGKNEGTGLYKSGFVEYSFGTVQLKAGVNTIVLRTANESKDMGGTTQAVAPMVDYIRLDYSGSNALSWCPIYDNLDKE